VGEAADVEGVVGRDGVILFHSVPESREAIAALAEKGVLHPITLAKRNRAWEARELFDLMNDVERELATPLDDDEPSRPSPRPGRTSQSITRQRWAGSRSSPLRYAR
jgi:hypothetical protein